jgi:VWFA-related protein
MGDIERSTAPGLIRVQLRIMKLVAALGIVSAFGATQEPAFRSETQLVQINVIVRDKNGPVSKLTANDFVLSDKGKPQGIRVFSVSSSGKTEAQALPAGTFSNRQKGADSGTVTIVLLDRLNTLSAPGAELWESHSSGFEDHALGYAKQNLIEFVKEMDPKNRVALYSLAESLTVLSDFSSDREQLQEILTAYRATSITEREKAAPGTVHTPVPGDFNGSVDRERQVLANITNQDRAQRTIAAFVAIANHAAGIPGRKNLIWLTANLPFPAGAAARVLSRANIAVYPVDARGLVTRGSAPGAIQQDMQMVPGMRTGSNGGDWMGSRPTGIDTMEDLAAQTGGHAFYNTNNLTEAIHRAVDDGAVTYTLGFYPDVLALDDKFHELKVHVKHAGYEVRYPKGYFAQKEMPVSEAQQQNLLQEAILSPLESSSIRLQAQVERGKANSIALAGSIDVRDLQLTAAGEGTLDLYVIQQDATGRVLEQKKNRLNLRLTPELYAAYLKSGILFREAFEPKEGFVTMRLLVSDPRQARVGSLIIPVSEVK